ncbi:MAG: hypothetical protein KDB22_18650 [Planctomycetales bacterium]|nr:hypothetical protein [Planctomycetales bacterium]
MNYLAHAHRFLDDPYFAAGTALPDWMSVIDRKNRPRKQYAVPVTQHDDPIMAGFARGVVQHHEDDFWFHQNPPFVSLSTAFAVEVRQMLEPGLGHQAGFTGHIVVELLLDAVLCERDPTLLDRYYQMLHSLDAALVEAAANEICRKPVSRLAWLIPRFIDERFLADYADDQRLLWRLNGVMKRVGIPQLPTTIANWLASARPRVRELADDLLPPT